MVNLATITLRTLRRALTFAAMTPPTRVAALAATLIALVAVTACSANPPSGAPSPGVSTPAVPAASGGPTSSAPTSAPAPVPTENIDGTLFFLGVGQAGGIYYLHNNTLTLAVSDASFGFYQSATMSPDGKKLAWVLADAAGATGQLKVQTFGGGTLVLGPSTISNTYTPQWSADSGSVIVGYGSGAWGRLNVTTGVMTPMSSASGCCFGVFSPDGAYAILRNGVTNSVAHADGSGPVPIAAPSGQVYSRIQSLSPDHRHVIALLRSAGSPGGDAGRALGANALVDTVTGAVVPMADGGQLKGGFYLPNGNAVLRLVVGGADRVRLVAPSGAVLDEVVVPPAAANHLLLGYAP
jgi:hypothetical protein